MNSMKDILSALDNAKQKSSSPSANDSMRSLLESIDKINESVSVNISATGDTPEDVMKVLSAMTTGDDAVPTDDTVDYGNDGYSDHEQDVFQGTLSGSGTLNRSIDEYNNDANDVEYQDMEDIVDPPSNDLNRKKSGYRAAAGGDNPMSMREQDLKEQLHRDLQRHMKSLEKSKK